MEKLSFYEILTGKLIGKWCDGLVLISITEENISINNIYEVEGQEVSINGYPIILNEKEFSKAIELPYELAIKEFNLNKKSLKSPKVFTDDIMTFNGSRNMGCGGNVYQHCKNNQIIVNDKEKFDSLNEILNFGFINEKEKRGNWLVF